MKEFYETDSLALAKMILDDFTLTPRSGWENTTEGYYSKRNLGVILRKPEREGKIYDKGEHCLIFMEN